MSGHNHNTMDMTTMAMGDTTMDHMHHMNHTGMNHTAMNHTGMNHTEMDHSGMDHSGMGHSGMDHSGMNHMGHMMKMYFHTGYEEYILFQDLLTESEGAMVGACAAVFFVAVLYEGLKFWREHLLQSSLQSNGGSSRYEVKGGTSQEQIVMQAQQGGSLSGRMLSCSHFCQTVLHMVQVFISYCLMLVFMTYNVWLCLAVVVGAGVGYFVFGWRRAVVIDSNEHCH